MKSILICFWFLSTLLAYSIDTHRREIYVHRSNITLNQAAVNQPLVVRAVRANNVPVEWTHWLEDIGFLNGEHAMVLKRPLISGGALVVRIGLSTFALHPQEAACIEVTAVS